MKKYILGIFAMIFAISLSAYTVTKNPVTYAGEKWYQLNTGGDPDEQSDYTLFGNGSTAPNCTGTNVCAILAQPDSQDPDSPNLGTIVNTRFRATP